MEYKVEEVVREAIRYAKGYSKLILFIGDSCIDECVKEFERQGGEITRLVHGSDEEYQSSRDPSQYYAIYLNILFPNSSSQAA